MTEPEWLSATDPTPMLEFLRDKASARELRLFACGCCRLLAEWVSDPRAGKALGAAERFADGEVTAATLARWWREADRAGDDCPTTTRPGQSSPAWVACHAVNLAAGPDGAAGWRLLARDLPGWATSFGKRGSGLVRRLPAVARDIFGNPFRPVTLDPSWLTSTVTALARRMYHTRDFSAMPILADALQDVGCEDEQLLNHCRAASVHVRGCWLVDLLLGKE